MIEAKVFAIAPYDGIKNLIEEVGKAYPRIHLTTFQGDLSNKEKALSEIKRLKPDVIMLRGLMADYISQNCGLPIVKIQLSSFDILSAIRSAQEYNRKFAIVGFTDITDSARLICDLMQYRTQIITVREEEDIRSALISLKSEGYSLVIGGILTSSIAEKIGMGGIVITSGRESVTQAFDQVVQIQHAFMEQSSELKLVKQAMDENKVKTVLFDVFGTLLPSQTIAYPFLTSTLEKMTTKVFKKERCSRIKKTEQGVFLIQGRKIILEDHTYGVFYIEKIENPISVSGIKVLNSGDIKISFPDVVYGRDGAMHTVVKDALKAAKSDDVILIGGESGTEKENFAHFIFKNSLQYNQFMVVVDLSLVDKAVFEDFCLSHAPLINSGGITFLFKRCEYTAPDLSLLIEKYMENKLNRYIFIADEGIGVHKNSLFQLLGQQENLSVLSLMPLRERKEDIVNFFNLFLSVLNMKNSHKIIGLEEAGAEYIKAYPWPQNLFQMKRVTARAVRETDKLYISKETVEAAILAEERISALSARSMPMQGTLKEITKEIILIILKEENYNKTRTAQRLNISRSKLWAILKDD